MPPYGRSGSSFSRPIVAAAVASAWIATCVAIPAQAAPSTLRAYGPDQGLTDVGVSCLHQNAAGLLLVCTQHGVYTYDGRRFTNLGTAQGLRDGGEVYNIATSAGGRLAVSYVDNVFVSTGPDDARHPPSSLSFRPVLHPEISFYNDGNPNRVVAWQDGFVLVANGLTFRIRDSDGQAARFEAMSYDHAEQETLTGARAVFSVHGHLWESFDDNRLCLADPGAVRCFDTADGLRSGPWFDVVAGAHGQVLARSASSVATFDPASQRWSVATLPDQGGAYLSYPLQLGLFRTPDGRLVTQSVQGLDILEPGGWKILSARNGVPTGTIMAARTDSSGQFWLAIFGRGLVRWVGYGQWESLQKGDGLSAGLAWQTARTNDGSVWVSTDTGLDRVARHDGSLDAREIVAGPSFALAVTPKGNVWSSHGSDGGRAVDPTTNAVTRIEASPIDVLTVDPSGAMWVGTEAGLFEARDPDAEPPVVARTTASRTPVLDIKPDGTGGIFYIAGNRLRHLRRNGVDAPVSGPWPGGGFEPDALVIDHAGAVWLGGAGGLFRFTLSGDRIVSYRAIPVSDTQTNSIPALMIDHRGWIWVGTTLGASVFDGRRWVSIDTSSGLIGDDVNQGGLREDPDGSVWIATAEGVSHLLDPTTLFHARSLRVIIGQAMLGDRPITGRRVPYTRAPFSVQLGTSNYGVEQSIRFEFRLSGVDSEWESSSSGNVYYPFVPPGRHTLTIFGVDGLTHRASAPIALTLKIAWPWWKSWWFEATVALLALVSAAVSADGVMRLRYRSIYKREVELRRLVAEQTAQLRFVASHDKLTGLLTRAEVQDRLAARLASGAADDETAVALIDIDHFKQINDTHGHLAGDDVLQTLGRVVSRHLREGECAGRYGGEEFLLVLDDADGGAADRILDLHHMIRGAPYPSEDKVLRLTCSVGIAWATPGDDWKSLLGRADAALYRAKRDGRDRIAEGSAPGKAARS